VNRGPIRLQWALVGLIVGTGVLGLVGQAWLRQRLESRIDIHVLLALLLCALIASRFWNHLQSSKSIDTGDLRHLSRQSTRLVYLLLYLIIGLRAVLGMCDCTWAGTTCDLSVFAPQIDTGFKLYDFNPHDDFQALLLCGLFALAAIRLVALFIHARGKLPRKTRRIHGESPIPRHRWIAFAANSDIAGRFRAR
jgi:cytochrome b561